MYVQLLFAASFPVYEYNHKKNLYALFQVKPPTNNAPI